MTNVWTPAHTLFLRGSTFSFSDLVLLSVIRQVNPRDSSATTGFVRLVYGLSSTRLHQTRSYHRAVSCPSMCLPGRSLMCDYVPSSQPKHSPKNKLMFSTKKGYTSGNGPPPINGFHRVSLTPCIERPRPTEERKTVKPGNLI